MTARCVFGGIFALALLVIAAAPAACNPDGQACAPGDFRYCDCASVPRGYSQCLDDGSQYGACDCSGTIPRGAGILVEAGPDVEAGAAETGKAGFLQPCVNNTDCTTNLCFSFNAYGQHCSHPCTKDIDCEAPSPGCSNKGVCKLH